MSKKAENMIGCRSGRLVVVGEAERAPREARWLCRCDCGKEIAVRASKIKSGHTRSCGCLKSEETSKRFLKHGHSAGGRISPTYQTWENMLHRCLYHTEYAGRGITVCERWKSFANFLADMGERPKGLTIERKNNEGNYEPGNCKWATYSEQNSNQRTRRPRTRRHGNCMLTDDQVRAILHDARSGAEIGRELGLDRGLINRIKSGVGYQHVIRDAFC
ncbi:MULTISPECIES: hypothetical protein [unclassified Mesorhizobium]|uniref:hypothetical protein n=1 Tax=unclassified Mesorhizobium TaxID=325217 RepID=UPI000FD8D048|nr:MULTISPECIES: hypothetical protein [unclassified Mesorhizobium]TGT76145.1 hypothetical protein EN809_000530 [Mesorhizobium sp. M2E.F.Ca.ET.166.01.1.1]TGW02260.1 hypothetical protein EN797_000530 [Mesorhizobium sp. M2E.F.Ca.ET.154.01.1.1]